MPSALRSLPPPAKKRKLSVEPDTIDSIKVTEDALTKALSNNTSINGLADLVNLTTNAGGAEATSKAIYALYRIFTMIINDGKLKPQADDSSKAIRIWIWERLNTYVNFLGGLLQDEEKMLRMSSLQILFSLLKHLSTSATTSGPNDEPQFHISHFRKIIGYLLLCPPSTRSASSSTSFRSIQADVRDTFVDTILSVHDDIRWFFLRDAGTAAEAGSTSENPLAPTNMLSILEKLHTFPTAASQLKTWWVPGFETKPAKLDGKGRTEADEEEEPPSDEEAEDDWRKFFDEPVKKNGPKLSSIRLHKMSTHQSLYSLNSHRAVYTKAWLGLLPLLSKDSNNAKSLSVRVLNIMHRGILPHLTRPILVMDWVATCVDFGGTAGLLALNALFVLMKDYNLDYPSFYTRLYTFLDRDVLHVKHRARFFRMTELFLSSTHIPATLLASFVKRLSRLSLHASPSAIVMVIPFVYNILKRHPALMVMIHRDPNPEGPFEDPFDPAEPNPLNTHALDSSLWELASHTTHYHTAVSTLARIFQEPFTRPGFSMEDFLDHTYGTLIETDTKRKVKKDPPLSIELELQSKQRPELFPLAMARNEEEEAVRDIVGELWTFGGS